MKYLKRALVWSVFAVAGLTVAFYYIDAQVLTPNVSASNTVGDENTTSRNNKVVEVNSLVTRNILLRSDSTWQLNSPLASSIDELLALALSGDSEARFVLARNLEYCYYSARSDQEHEIKRQQALSYSDADSAISRIDERYRYCIDVQPSVFAGFFSHLEASAAAGFVLAQEHYGAINTDFYMKVQGFNELKRDDYIAKREAFENRKVEFLDRAMRSGSINAMARLSQLASHQLGSYGLVEAYAINNVIMQLTDDNTLFNRYAWLNEKLEQRLTQTEVLDALAQSQALITTINNSPTL